MIEAAATKLMEASSNAAKGGRGGDEEAADMISLETVRDTLEAALEEEMGGGEREEVCTVCPTFAIIFRRCSV